MDIEEGRITNMVFGYVRAAYKESKRRKCAGNYTQPELGYKMEAIKLLLEMKNEDYIFKTYHYLFAKYRREKGGDL